MAYFFSTEGTNCKDDMNCRHYLVEYVEREKNHMICATCQAQVPLIGQDAPTEKEFLEYIIEKYDLPPGSGVITSGPAQFDWDYFEIPADEKMTPEREFAQLVQLEYFKFRSDLS
jgi:hypothetical protein